MSKLLENVVGEFAKLPGVGRRTALRLALRSYADKLACQRILSLIAPQEEKSERRKKYLELEHTSNFYGR